MNVEGPSTANPGTAFAYIVTISENSLNNSDGATFTNASPGGATDVAATCRRRTERHAR